MTRETALAAIDRLLAGADPGAPVTVGFLGGEPLTNRALVHEVVGYARGAAAPRGLDLRFSITTNGTLLSPADIALIRAERFAVTVSLDGDAAIQDRQRPAARGTAASPHSRKASARSWPIRAGRRSPPA